MAESIEEEYEIIEAHDEGFEDEGTGGSDAGSSLTSLQSSIVRGVTENGRTYAAYGKEEYGMPMDEQEMDRIDMSHAKYFMLLERKRFLAPIPDHPQKILELGCGTGIWSIDIADDYPSAEVIGVDIAPIQPRWVAPNCRFEIDDIEQPWTWRPSSFDFIFARDLLLSIRDFPKLISQCYTHLKPGGHIEFESIYGVVKCDDDSLPPDSDFITFNNHVQNAANAMGCPLTDCAKFVEWFEEAGFECVVEKKFKIPSNPWPKDPRLRLIGAFELEMFLNGLEGMSLRLFERGMGWTAEETTVFLTGVRKDIRNQRFHAYYPFYVIHARKPETAE
ncbi:S-adenosyl-L-methionine-dependent methyltransferase [Mollisia scopiformis]|uniref:S-adenosyl-L-methionine-dependent methyltransferase n=1 Tax=Mollisia scopiformis TaxID=149040 RepID=A0A194XFE1_MOLSC|nr:S-adenosyl-L-methionine-dependent methyltransferase [Mollisia scopiformis]KUJ18487.1 S-adenosyl-L-methionine-dependent methyltransferase [Mollisia scopiformis]